MERKIKDRQVACSELKPEWIHQGKKKPTFISVEPSCICKKKTPDTITTIPGVYKD